MQARGSWEVNVPPEFFFGLSSEEQNIVETVWRATFDSFEQSSFGLLMNKCEEECEISSHAPILEEDPEVTSKIEAMAVNGGPLDGLF